MKGKYIRFFTPLLVALLILQSTLPLQAQAAYENTHANTGNQRKDIVAVALSQLGYREGSNNDTKYGDWYGMPHQPWCAMFVSWCADQAGVSTGIIAKNARAHPTYFGLTAKSGSSYKPRAGDLFFCKRGGTYAHVGIVYYVDGDYFYTIEGNANSGGSFDGIGVFSLKRKISACYFSSPKYLGNEDCNYVQSYDDAHPHKAFYKCSDCGDRYYTTETGSLDTCQTCIIENCEHNFTTWAEGEKGHSRSCDKCTLTETKDHEWSVQVIQKANCSQAGSQEKTCKTCGAFQAETIPQSTKHNFSSWKNIDEKDHSRTCSVCATTQRSAHTFSKEWLSDETGHYKKCSGCGLKDQVIAHDFSQNCEAGCSECGFVSGNVHSFTEQWEIDGDNHWHLCSLCSQPSEAVGHSFDHSCDTDCNECGYVRQTEHSFASETSYDDQSHWIECTVCQLIKDQAEHIGDSSITDVTCEGCSFVIPHVHSYAMVEKNEDSHWGVCACSQTDEAQPHQWQDSRICPICQEEKPLGFWFWLAVIGSPVLIALGIFTFLLIRTKRKQGLYC